MTRRRGSVSALALGVLVAAGACRNQSQPSETGPAAATSGTPPATLVPVSTGTLPEDPEAGARSAAQWREHLAREERERRLGYDRRKLSEHEAVLKKLRAARRSYDGARTKSAVLSAERAFESTRPNLLALFETIDHWGVSSKVLPDYQKLVETFSAAYPAARIAALTGDPAEFERVEREVDERFRAVDAWLHEAEESEDE